jgi:hypothetical protein
MNAVNKPLLVEKFKLGTISHFELGKLRKLSLIELLDDLITLDANELKRLWLDKNASKLVTSKIAEAIGYDTKPHNVRQSFKKLVLKYEKVLKERGIIIKEKLTNEEVGQDNAKDFLAFIDERLNDVDYQWPRNEKGGVYRRVLWALYLDIDPADVKGTPSFFSRHSDVARKLIDIDLLLVEDKIKWLDYKSESALEAMSDTMLSRALSKYRVELKQAREELVLLREQNAELEQKLKFYDARDEAMVRSGINSFKAGSAH